MMLDFNYDNTNPNIAARQIIGMWANAVLKGNAADLHVMPNWTPEHRAAVRAEVENLRDYLLKGCPDPLVRRAIAATTDPWEE